MNLDISEIDRCCKKVCEDIDEEIKARKESRFLTAKRFYPSTQHSIYALEDLRDRLREEGTCKCEKTITEISSRKSQAAKAASERKRYPATISAGLTRFSRSGTPILPSPVSDGCCIYVCRTLNAQIKSVDDVLDASVIQRASIEMEPLEIEAIKKESMGGITHEKRRNGKKSYKKSRMGDGSKQEIYLFSLSIIYTKTI